jgi:hypothetical protein
MSHVPVSKGANAMRLPSVLAALASALCLGAPLLCAPAVAAPQSRQASVQGAGNLSCGRWTAEQPPEMHSPLRVVFTNWLGGYVTGYNAYRGGDALKGAHWDSAIGWMDDYCAAHPSVPVAAAAGRLLIHLQRAASARDGR